MADEQDIAEMVDEEARGTDAGPETHTELLGPDGGGNDDVAEMVGTFEDAEGPQPPEEAALHVEPPR